MSKWEEKRLNTICDVISGYAFKSNDFVHEGIPVIKISNIGNDFCDIENNTQYVCTDFLNELQEKYILSPNSILISLTGSHITQANSMVGRSCRYTQPYKALLNQRAGRIIPKLSIKQGLFIYYIMQSQWMKEYIGLVAYGAANQANISPKTIEKIKVYLPDLPTQERIADILSAYDDLIENNNRRIKLLEKAAQDLYKEWFVRFRFPNHENTKFVNGLPEGWEVKRLGDISIIKAGGDKPKSFSDVKDGHYSVAVYSNGISNDGLYGYTDKATIESESITVSARGTIGFICLRTEPYVPIVRLISVEPINNFINGKYLYFALKNSFILGNGTSQQQLTVPDFKRNKVLVPVNDLLDSFTKIVDLQFHNLKLLKQQNLNLKKQRDLLLPRLMSGKLEV